MFEELLACIGLVLALYGIACIISSIAIWFTAPGKKGHGYWVAVLKEDDHPILVLRGVTQRLRNSGMHRRAVIVAVDSGLDVEKRALAERYCQQEGIIFCQPHQLEEVLQFTPFQT